MHRVGTTLTLKRQIFAEVQLHRLLGALSAAFRIVYNSLLADCQANHGWVLRPLFEVQGTAVLLQKHLLEDVVGGTRTHGYGGAATLYSWPRHEVADGDVVGVV